MSDKRVAPAVVEHPEARTTDSLEATVIDTSVARSAHEESSKLVDCFRHEGEECPRCDGSGFRPVKHCTGCNEAAGSVSEGTGFPLVRDRDGDGHLYHIHCLPGMRDLDAVWSSLERMGG